MLFGLLGKNIAYSFSKKYFTKKFNTENLNHQYENIDLDNIDNLTAFLLKNKTNLKGFNVTIPYKQDVFQFLDQIDTVAQEIGAVNCVKIIVNQHLKGFNTDAYGFEQSILPLLKKRHKKALILGTGGASKAVAYTFNKLQIEYKFVSRNPQKNQLSYSSLTKDIIKEYKVIVNTTPLGTKGKSEDECANIPYQYIGKNHLLYDLIYNPKKTLFLKKGKKKGAKTKNGLKMLKLQADKSWEIWNGKPE